MTAEELLARYAAGERKFENIDFSGIPGDRSWFHKVILENAEFKNCNFYMAIFSYANVNTAKFISCNLRETQFNHCLLYTSDAADE